MKQIVFTESFMQFFGKLQETRSAHRLLKVLNFQIYIYIKNEKSKVQKLSTFYLIKLMNGRLRAFKLEKIRNYVSKIKKKDSKSLNRFTRLWYMDIEQQCFSNCVQRDFQISSRMKYSSRITKETWKRRMRR